MNGWDDSEEVNADSIARLLAFSDTRGITIHRYPLLGRITVVTCDPIKLESGIRNCRVASRDIEVLSYEQFEHQCLSFRHSLAQLRHIGHELANRLVREGILSFGDLSVVAPDELMQLGNLSAEEADGIIEQAEIEVERREGRGG